jgi:hypothetical protein
MNKHLLRRPRPLTSIVNNLRKLAPFLLAEVLRSTIPQPLLFLLGQLTEFLRKAVRSSSTLKELNKETLSLVVTLTATSRLLRRKRHQLFSAEAAAKVEEGVRLVLPFTVFGSVICEIGGGCSVDRCAGGGLELDDEDFEDLEGCRHYCILVRI